MFADWSYISVVIMELATKMCQGKEKTKSVLLAHKKIAESRSLFDCWIYYLLCGIVIACNFVIGCKLAMTKNIIWRCRVSIPVPLTCEASALPFELHPHLLRLLKQCCKLNIFGFFRFCKCFHLLQLSQIFCTKDRDVHIE